MLKVVSPQPPMPKEEYRMTHIPRFSPIRAILAIGALVAVSSLVAGGFGPTRTALASNRSAVLLPTPTKTALPSQQSIGKTPQQSIGAANPVVPVTGAGGTARELPRTGGASGSADSNSVLALFALTLTLAGVLLNRRYS